MHRILPIWRRNALVRTDWPLADQAFALHALVTGFAAAATGRPTRPTVTDPDKVLAAAVTALVGPEHASPDQVKASAEDGLRSLAEARAAALDLISPEASPRRLRGALLCRNSRSDTTVVQRLRSQ